jgi:carboxymethylenebutenolidase
MCHSADDKLPASDVPGPVRPDGRGLILTSQDGTRFLAYHAMAADAGGTGVVVLPSANGLVPFFQELCCRLAAVGYHTLGMDYYGRTAGTTPRFDQPKIYPQNMPLVRPEQTDMDLARCVEFLRSAEGGACEHIVTIGFCFGGAMSWRQSARGAKAVVGFYGNAADLRESVSDLRDLHAPLLFLVAGNDKVYSASEQLELAKELESLGIPHRVVLFEGAPHGFFRLGEWQRECDLAWQEVMNFLNRYGGERT